MSNYELCIRLYGHGAPCPYFDIPYSIFVFKTENGKDYSESAILSKYQTEE